MWKEILERWLSDEHASLVLPGALARDRFLRRLGERTLWGAERVITLEELWREVAGAVGDAPATLTAPEVEPLLADQVADFDRLRPLVEQRGGLKALQSHLEEIEKQADADYDPQTELEEQIAELRRRLNARPRVLWVAHRSHVARQAKFVELGRALHFAPLPESSRQLGGLLKGLARRNEVYAYVLSGEALLDEWLERTGIPAACVARRPSGDAAASSLFTGRAPRRPERPRVEWLSADDEVGAALELAGRWIAAGTPAERIAILAPEIQELAHPVVQAAREAGVPVLVRDAVEVHQTRVSRLLLRLAEHGPEDLPEGELSELEGLGAGPEELEEVARARAASKTDELRALYLLGRRLAERCDAYEAARAHAWLEGLHTAVSAVLTEGVEPWSVPDLLASTVSLRAARGDAAGVVLASYAEAPALELEGVILLGLNDTELSRGRSRSPFTSEELLSVCPALRPVSERGRFAAACASAQRRLALICPADRERSPSPLFTETQRAWDAPGETVEARLDLARTRARRLARRRVDHPEVREALTRIARERLPDPWVDAAGRRAYSVTELEDYLRCPYGWFVKHVLMPQAPPNDKQLLGTLMHEILAEALGEPADERPAVLARRLEEAQLSAAERRILRPRLERVLADYAGPSWPFPERRAELPLRVELENEELGGLITLYGRADRVDLREGAQTAQLLVLDYKSNPSVSASPKPWQLQPFLYPWMASRQLQAEPLGFLYVSLRDGSRRGWLRSRLPELTGPEIDYGWERQAAGARQRVEAAIKGIEEGRWSAIGRGCDRRWCPHTWLSDTGVAS